MRSEVPFFGIPADQLTSLRSVGRFACQSMTVESDEELLHQHLDVYETRDGLWNPDHGVKSYSQMALISCPSATLFLS